MPRMVRRKLTERQTAILQRAKENNGALRLADLTKPELATANSLLDRNFLGYTMTSGVLALTHEGWAEAGKPVEGDLETVLTNYSSRPPA